MAALVGDGRRVLVTAATTEELAAVRAALRPDVADRGLDTLPDLSPGELRELRRLLVTALARPRRAAPTSSCPSADRVPHPGRSRRCARGPSTRAPPGPAAAMVPELLAGIDHVRREAVTSVARYVHRSLRAMYPRADRQWAWDLLGELIYSRHRPAFDQLLEDTAQAVGALDRARHLPSVAVVGAAARRARWPPCAATASSSSAAAAPALTCARPPSAAKRCRCCACCGWTGGRRRRPRTCAAGSSTWSSASGCRASTWAAPRSASPPRATSAS